jgi:hypothetical protein
MLTLLDMLDAAKPDGKPQLIGDERATTLKETFDAMELVRRNAQAALAKAADAKQKIELKTRIAATTLTEAGLLVAAEKPDWPRVLKTLEGFEARTADLPNREGLDRAGQNIRIRAYVGSGQPEKAGEVLDALIKTGDARAAGLAYGILQQLNVEFDKVKTAGDMGRARNILKLRASLSLALVDSTAKSTKPEMQARVYAFRRYAADAQRQYGESLEGAERIAQLQKAKTAFLNLRSPAIINEYKAMVLERKKNNPEDKTDPDAPDPSVQLGLALVSYGLEDWKTAAVELKNLRFTGKLGTRTLIERDPITNEEKVVPNDQYWEANYKYYSAVVKWAAAAPNDDDAAKELDAVKIMLRRDYVAGPDEVGGPKWHEQFEELRKQLIPDLNLDELRKPGAASQPAQARARR